MTFTTLYSFILLISSSYAAKPIFFLNSSRVLHADTYETAAAVTNSETCTNVALEILADDGAAADAAIAALLCEGVTNPQSMGIGGGFLLTIYNASSNSAEVLNAREVAPGDATKDMLKGDDNGISMGGLSSAVPGELVGYWELHQKYGRMAWYDLFRPSVELARHGVPVTKYTANIISKLKKYIVASPTIKDILWNPSTGTFYAEGDTMKRPILADTLEKVAKYGPNVLYDGTLTNDFIYDLNEHGSIITKEDLKSYKAIWMKPVKRKIGHFEFFTAPKPGSGELLIMILEIMTSKLCNLDANLWHYFIETWKYVYGTRAFMTGPTMGEIPEIDIDRKTLATIENNIKECLGSRNPDDYLLKETNHAVEDHGTSHICIHSPDGDVVSVTSTINLSFGALYMSPSTGIIMNNQMIDFSIPHHYSFKTTEANEIAPYRHPMSSMVPTIVTYDGEIRLVIGSSGGFKILTSVSIVTLFHLYMDFPLEEAIRMKRLHHQLKPMVVEYEEGFDSEVLQALQHKGHATQSFEGNLNNTEDNNSWSLAMYSSVNAIAVIDGSLIPVGDSRRQAVAGGY